MTNFPRDTEQHREDAGTCAEPVRAWHDRKGTKSLTCARRAVNGAYCTQHAKRHRDANSVDKSKCFFPPKCPGCSNCDPFRPM